MNILCRIGMHKWREHEFALGVCRGTGRVCSCCGKREVWNCLYGRWQKLDAFPSDIAAALKDAEAARADID